MQCKLAIICQLSERTAQRQLTAGFAVSSCVDVFSSTAIVAEVAVVVGAPMSVCVCVRACVCVRVCVVYLLGLFCVFSYKHFYHIGRSAATTTIKNKTKKQVADC